MGQKKTTRSSLLPRVHKLKSSMDKLLVFMINFQGVLVSFVIIYFWILIEIFIGNQKHKINQFLSYLFAHAFAQLLIVFISFVDCFRISSLFHGFLSYGAFLNFISSRFFPLIDSIFFVYLLIAFHFFLLIFIHKMISINIKNNFWLFFALLSIVFTSLVLSKYFYSTWWQNYNFVSNVLINLLFLHFSYLSFILISILDIDNHTNALKQKRWAEFNEIYLNQ